MEWRPRSCVTGLETPIFFPCGRIEIYPLYADTQLSLHKGFWMIDCRPADSYTGATVDQQVLRLWISKTNKDHWLETGKGPSLVIDFVPVDVRENMLGMVFHSEWGYANVREV